MIQQNNQSDKAKEWRHKLLIAVSGLLIFETLSGLSIYLLPFSISNQVIVLVHTVIGLIFILPFIWYQIRHWQIYRSKLMNQLKLTGYFSMLSTIVAGISGLVLTYQALFHTKISYGWDLAHIISTFALLASVLPHLVSIVLRDFKSDKTELVQPIQAAQKQFGFSQLIINGALFALVFLLVFAYEPVKLNNELPDDYSYLYGPEEPFAPSLAKTSTGKA
ncbi:MAG: hypothetical protein GY808_10430, partial [Gammaproteobacteria bacterium]|nr:hypothetical protein [Gammaproteobacteria bacterium]